MNPEPLSDARDRSSNLSDTQLQYNVYVSLKETQSIDALHDELNTFTNQLAHNYIWNNEPFSLKKKPKQAGHLYVYENVMDFGENVDDEWFVVYILTRLTKYFRNQNYHVVARAYDSDDDFMLIHLANHLPEWASHADNNCMNNRVFIYNGQLHMIKPATNPSEITYLPSTGFLNTDIGQAVNCIIDFERLTCASSDLQAGLNKRLAIFDNFEKTLQHQTTLSLPAKLVWVLNQPHVHQSCMSAAVNRFFEKDSNDLKICRTLSVFKPDSKTNPLVDYRVMFTKFLFSKLKHASFKIDSQADKSEKLNLGLKLTCAFEILARSEPSSFKYSKKYKQFLDNLKRKGYFKDFLEGSVDFNRLLDEANRTYSKQFVEIEDTTPVQLLVKAIEAIPSNYIELLERDVLPKQKGQSDDRDDWLNVDMAHFDDYLEAYSNGQVNSTYDFDLLSNAFKKFFKNKDLDYTPINGNTERQLIDFSIDSIESSLNEILLKTERRDDSDDEGDSFYEVDDDDLDSNPGDTDHDNEDQNIKNYIESMDKELECEKDLSRLLATNDTDDDELSLNLNLVSNAIESYSSQSGLSGPVSNILKSLGI
jgi:hypothetical protein